MQVRTNTNPISMALLMIVIGIAFMSHSVHAAVDMFLKIEGVDGESKDANHEKWIDVLSIDWGYHKPGSGATASAPDGVAGPGTLTLTKNMDAASPKLQQACQTGEPISEMTLNLPSPQAGQMGSLQYITYHLENVIVSCNGSGSRGDQLPSESISLVGERVMQPRLGAGTREEPARVAPSAMNSTLAAGDADDRPTEEVSFYYEKISVQSDAPQQPARPMMREVEQLR